MDPITVGINVGVVLIPQLIKKLMEMAAEPENVARSVNWVFSAVDHFMKVRKSEKPRDTSIAPPPVPTPDTRLSAEVDESGIEDKAEAVHEIAKSLEQETQAPAEGGVRLIEMDDFAMEQLANEITSQISKIEIYLRNLRFEEERAAQHGGLIFAPSIVMNTMRIQQEEIAKSVQRLNQAMQKAYGVAASDLDILVRVTQDRHW